MSKLKKYQPFPYLMRKDESISVDAVYAKQVNDHVKAMVSDMVEMKEALEAFVNSRNESGNGWIICASKDLSKQNLKDAHAQALSVLSKMEGKL